MTFRRRTRFINKMDLKWKLGLWLMVFLLFVNFIAFINKADDDGPIDIFAERQVEDIIRDKVYGEHDLFRSNNGVTDKILVITYSNMGLDVSSAVLSNHPDLWYVSGSPLDPILRSMHGGNASSLASLRRIVEFVKDALSCQLNVSQVHLIRDRSLPHVCSQKELTNPEDFVKCANNLCKQKAWQAIALRDIKLTDVVQSVIYPFINTIKIVLLQETAIDNDQHAKIKCQRMISDTDHAAELEAKTHGIHSIFFLEHFAHQWLNHALALAAFVGLDVDSLHTKAAIKHRPDGLISYKRKMNTSPWLSLVDKCQAYT